MALTDENSGFNVSMPVAPAYGFGGNNGGFGFGGDWAWILLLLVLGGGWGGFGMNGALGAGAMGMEMLYPWMNNSQNINDGFRDQQLATQVSGIQNAVTSGFGDVQTALCGGFAGVNAAITNAQMANLERSFAAQTANTAGLTNLSSQLANCCCENRAATADLKYTVATENCADRAALSDGIRDILAATQAQTQTILDKMCQDKIDAKNEKIVELQNALSMAQLSASQAAQTAAIEANNTAQTQYIVNRVAPYPIPSYTVPNPFVTTTGGGTATA